MIRHQQLEKTGLKQYVRARNYLLKEDLTHVWIELVQPVKFDFKACPISQQDLTCIQKDLPRTPTGTSVSQQGLKQLTVWLTQNLALRYCSGMTHLCAFLLARPLSIKEAQAILVRIYDPTLSDYQAHFAQHQQRYFSIIRRLSPAVDWDYLSPILISQLCVNFKSLFTLQQPEIAVQVWTFLLAQAQKGVADFVTRVSAYIVVIKLAAAHFNQQTFITNYRILPVDSDTLINYLREQQQ